VRQEAPPPPAAAPERKLDLRRVVIACFLLCAVIAGAVGLGTAFELSPRMWSAMAMGLMAAAGLLALLPQIDLKEFGKRALQFSILFGTLLGSLLCGVWVAGNPASPWIAVPMLCAPTIGVALAWPGQWALIATATALVAIGALPGAAASVQPPVSYPLAAAVLGCFALGSVYGRRSRPAAVESPAPDVQEPSPRQDRPSVVALELARLFALHERGAVGQVVVNEIARALGACGAILLLWDETAEAYRIDAITGSGPVDLDEIRQVELHPDWIPRARRIDANSVVALDPASLREPVLQSLMRRWHAKSLQVVPFCRGSNAVGVLMLVRSKARAAFSETESEILAALAPHASAALAHAALIADLESANALKEEFMATMSHELRTPLNVIIGYTDMQLEGAFGDLDEEHSSTLNTVREQAVQLLELIQATLDMSRLERGLVSLDPTEVEIDQVLGDLQKKIPPAWRKPGVQLEWKIDSGLPGLCTDAHKLQILLRNLIHNAMKFTESGLVLVSAKRHPSKDCITFLVQDSGVGIKAEHLSQIFEMFRQAPDGESHSGGVGLGLYIVKRLAAALGAEIEVSSAPGRGATFRIHLPLDPEPAEAPAAE